MTKTDKGIPIPFHIHPYLFEQQQHAVEKEDSQGVKRRYLYGISSGMKVDATGERMTKECIADMQKQANSGEILLYPSPHGVRDIDDIGRLVESQITPGGDWVTTYRLYDKHDGIGPNKLENIETLWRQINGLPPYKKATQKGFSIEGYIPDNGIIEMTETGQRTIGKVNLDGAIVTSRPAYTDSVLTAVYKALDVLPPAKIFAESENIRGTFMNLIHDEEMQQSFYSKKYKLDDALHELIEKIMVRGTQVQDRLNLLFDEYKQMMIQLLIEHRNMFKPDDLSNPERIPVDVAKMQRERVLCRIHDLLKIFKSMVDGRKKIHKERNRGRNNTKRPCPGGTNSP